MVSPRFIIHVLSKVKTNVTVSLNLSTHSVLSDPLFSGFLQSDFLVSVQVVGLLLPNQTLISTIFWQVKLRLSSFLVV